jgi:basic membrane protein A
MINKREAKVYGGENIPMNFANGGFVFKYNEKVGSVLTPAIRKAVDAAQKDMKAGKLQLAWKDVKF